MESPTHKLLGHHPHIDNILQVPHGYLKSPAKIWALRSQLRSLKIDVSIDPQSLTKSSALGWLSGAPTRIGLAGTYGKELSRIFNNTFLQPGNGVTHLVDRTLSLLPAIVRHSKQAASSIVDPDQSFQHPFHSTAITAETSDHQESTNPAQTGVAPDTRRFAKFQLPVPKADQIWLAQTLSDLQIGQRYVVLNPGASWPSKRWEHERFAEVARTLFQNTSTPTIVTWAGGEEKGWAEQIVQQAGQGVLLAPATSLTQFCALASQAKLFLGCDTGPMHMAAALGTPCVVLFGPTLSQDSGPYGLQHIAIQAWHQSGTARYRRSAENLAMQDIQTQTVVKACLTALDSQDGDSPKSSTNAFTLVPPASVRNADRTGTPVL